MIYGVINHQDLADSGKLSSLKTLLEQGSQAFTEKQFPGLAAGWLNTPGPDSGRSFYIDQDTPWSIFVFGQIYNLTGLGGGQTDPSPAATPRLLLNLFLEKGVPFADALNGDFIILISNAEEKTTWVFRDHLGIVPFSFTRADGGLYFCSDWLSLCRSFYPEEPPDPEFLLRDFKFTDNTLTPNPKVRRLLPGHYLLVKQQTEKQHKYWHPENIRTDKSYTTERVFREATALVEDAIKIRADRELPAASHLSGGLDSSAVAVLARAHYAGQEPFFGFSWSPAYPLFPAQGEKDERSLVEKTCAANRMEPVFSSFSSVHFTRHYEDPLHNSLFPHEQLTQAFSKERGIRLIFSGYGGDEFISCGTYGVFIDLLRTFQWRKYWRVARTWSPMTLVKSLVLDFLFPVTGILPPTVRLQNRASAKFLKKPFKKSHRKSLRHFFLHSSRRAMHLGMLYHYHIPLRTEEWYHWGIKHGIRYRYPLLDKRIVEFMLKIPSDDLFRESLGRVLLREAAGDLLPEEVRNSASKTDPALTKYLDDLSERIFGEMVFQLKGFRENPALAFFDFGKYEKALAKDKQGKPPGRDPSLRHVFFRLKWIHEFTRQYAQ